MGFTQTRPGVRIWSEVFGTSKDVLVFIHGWGMNWSVWKNQISFFLDLGFTCVAIDLCGHGKSSKPRSMKKYRLECLAEDVKEVLAARGIRKPVFIGHSLGGLLIIELIGRKKVLARGAVLVDSTYVSPARDWPLSSRFDIAPKIRTLLSFISKKTRGLRRKYEEVDFTALPAHNDIYYWVKGLKGVPIDVLSSSLLSLLDVDETEVLKTIKIPSLLIYGEKDMFTPIKRGRIMKRQIPNARLHIIKGAAHDSLLTHSKRVNKEIWSFIRHEL